MDCALTTPNMCTAPSSWATFVHFCSDQDEAVCEQYMQQAAAGLIYLHDRHIVHFDLKLENMLLHQNVIKLCDFG